ncbi:hypothetical protein [Bradyrhizobium neotropicale]|uniref:hypothetical protein n=1 Tax=Bradyrhizobium neotropicale TaxID=1497615 RepID=UPI001AD75E49|nr:hypothetical protein [Bradyrhizobium neotropicale]MBO4225299.1 hypothetical protein [Bradyrhizobium neotropicale]
MVLINLTRGETPASGGLAARHTGLSLLQAGLDLFALAPIIVDQCQPFGLGVIEQFMNATIQLESDALSIWGDRRFIDTLGSSDAEIIFLGGSWLEEEISIVALQAAERGYDVRLLSDLIQSRSAADRSLVFDRLSVHGVLATTVRQTLLEWAVCLDDPLLKQRVRELLS